MADRFAEYFLTLLAQVGGGRGGPENELVRFGLGSILWGALLFLSLKRRREEQVPHETLLAWGFGLGLAREAGLFLAVSLTVSGTLPSQALNPYVPPLENALSMAALCVVSAGLLRSNLGARGGGTPYLAAGAGGAAFLYLATAVPWAHHLADVPGGAFEATWYDGAFRFSTAAVLGWALALLTRVRGWVRTTLLAAFGCFFLDESLMLINHAADAAHAASLGPPGHVLHLAGGALLVYLSLKQMSHERDVAVSDLHTVINLTEDERRRTEAILDAIGDAVSVQDREFRVLYQNRVHRASYGDCAGRRCHEAYAGLPAPCPGCPVALAFADGGMHRLERPRAAAGGAQAVFEVTATCLRNSVGSVVAGIEVARDVTQRVAAAEELQEAKEALEHQNQELRTLDAMKDGLIRDVTHEFKTPVAKHAMQLEILRGILRGRGLERETGKVLDVMAASIARQQRMIRNILDLARLEAGGRRYRLGPVRLDEVVAEVLADRSSAIESYSVAVSCGVAPVALCSDREMLHCLLSNLVDNAIKYRTPGGGASIRIEAAEEGGHAVLQVSDNGIGLAPEQLERAFERFWQATASAEGSGVGLSICRMIAEDLGGSIAIGSPGPGRGTTVTVRLPSDPKFSFARRPAHEERGAAAAADPAHPHRPAHPPRVHRENGRGHCPAPRADV